jgi:hypothetical protein
MPHIPEDPIAYDLLSRADQMPPIVSAASARAFREGDTVRRSDLPSSDLAVMTITDVEPVITYLYHVRATDGSREIFTADQLEPA